SEPEALLPVSRFTNLPTSISRITFGDHLMHEPGSQWPVNIIAATLNAHPDSNKLAGCAFALMKTG
ncbi:MAG: hypothetical protein ABGZ53_34820, partial [Fuerstiella sp.]